MKNKVIIIISTIIILLACAFIAVKFINRETENTTDHTHEEKSETNQEEYDYVIEETADEEIESGIEDRPDEYIVEYNGIVQYVGESPFSLRVTAYDCTKSKYGFNYGYTDNCISFLYNITGADSFEVLDTDVSNNKYYYDIVINDHVYSIIETEVDAFVMDQYLTKEEALEKIADKGYL